MNIKEIALDLEGTCLDVEAAHHQGHIRAAADVGVTLTFEECLQKLPHFIGGPDEMVAKEISKLAGEADPEYILRRIRFHYNHLLKTMSIELRPGVATVLEWLKENGFKITIGSLTITAQATILLEKTGLARIVGVDNIVLMEDIRHVKPEPDVWLETARRAGIVPGEQLVFDDSPYGLIAARRAGCICIGMPVYNKPSVLIDLVKAGAARIFMDWREINIAALIENLSREF